MALIKYDSDDDDDDDEQFMHDFFMALLHTVNPGTCGCGFLLSGSLQADSQLGSFGLV